MLHVRLLVMVAAVAAASACASSRVVYTPRPFPMPGDPAVAPPTAAPPAVAVVPAPKTSRPIPGAAPSGRGADGYSVSSAALSFRGVPYRIGGTDPNGFDCSGLVSYVFEQHGLRMPRAAREQFKVGKNVARDQLQPGDLVFFSTVAPGASHVGIAIGGDQFVHAPSERGVVRVDQLSTQYWSTRYIGAKRIS